MDARLPGMARSRESSVTDPSRSLRLRARESFSPLRSVGRPSTRTRAVVARRASRSNGEPTEPCSPLATPGGSWIGWLNSRSTFGPITPSLARSSSARSLRPASRSPALLSSSSRTTRLAPIRGKRSSSSSRATAGSAPSRRGVAASRLPARTGSWVRRGPRRKRSIGLEKSKRTAATVTISAGRLMKVYGARFHQAAGRQPWRPKDERCMAHGSCSASEVRGSGAVDFQWP